MYWHITRWNHSWIMENTKMYVICYLKCSLHRNHRLFFFMRINFFLSISWWGIIFLERSLLLRRCLCVLKEEGRCYRNCKVYLWLSSLFNGLWKMLIRLWIKILLNFLLWLLISSQNAHISASNRRKLLRLCFCLIFFTNWLKILLLHPLMYLN